MHGTIQRWMMIHPGEGRVVLFPFLLCVMVGAGLGLGRASSDAILIARVGIEKLPHLLLATGPALALVSLFYAAFVDRMRGDVFFRYLLLALAAYVAGISLVMGLDDDLWPAVLYVLGYMVASEILVSQINHYALSFFDPAQGRRLLPVIAAGARLGGIVGGATMGLLSGVLPLKIAGWAWAVLLVAAAISITAYRRDGASAGVGAPRRGGHPLADLADGWRFARSSRFLQVTGIGMVLLVIAVSIQDYLTNALFQAHFGDEAKLAAFLGWFVAGANALTLILQLAITNRLLSRFGVKAVNLIYPLAALAGFAALTAVPGLLTAIMGRLSGQSLLPAFRQPAANLFYHAYPARLQGRARAFIAGTMLPIGFVVSGAVLILIPADRLVETLAWAGVILTAALIAFDLLKNRYYGESMMTVVRDLVFLGHGNQIDSSIRLDPTVVRRIGALLEEGRDPDFSESCVEILARGAPDEAVAAVRAAEPNMPDPIRDRAIRILARHGVPQWDDLARKWLITGDEHLRTTALRLLVQRAKDPCRGVVDDWLISPLPRLRAAAAEMALMDDDATRRERAEKTLRTLFDSIHAGHVIAGIGIVERLGGEWLRKLEPFLTHDDIRLRASAVRGLAAGPRHGVESLPSAEDIVARALKDDASVVRKAGLAALPAITDPRRRLSLLAVALEDIDVEVRIAAEQVAPECLPTHPDALRAALRAFADDFTTLSVLLQALARRALAQRSGILAEIAAVHVERAGRKEERAAWLRQVIRGGLAGSDRVRAAFLYEVLCEDVERHLDMALLAFEGMKTGVAVATVRAGIRSRDRRLRALAIETLRAFDGDKLMTQTRKVLERIFELRGADALAASLASTDDIADRAREALTRTEEWRTFLRWCAENGSQWLRKAVASTAPPPLPAEAVRGH